VVMMMMMMVKVKRADGTDLTSVGYLSRNCRARAGVSFHFISFPSANCWVSYIQKDMT
jgi:hypothetical protein